MLFPIFSSDFQEFINTLRSKDSYTMGVSNSRLLLPRAAAADTYVVITPFETGRMATEASTLVRDAQGPSMATSWRFLIKHPKRNKNIWFDMGISHVRQAPMHRYFPLDRLAK